MSAGPPSLDELRQEIDRIDEMIHGLLMARTAVVERIGQVKQVAGTNRGDGFFRPGREALVLRRLVARHRGPFPKRAIVRIWREIMAGQLRVQTPIPVAVHSDGRPGTCWDLARDQFGVSATALAMTSSVQVIRAIRDGRAIIGVVPMPEDGAAEPWWPLLATSENDRPSIVARLPFAPPSGADGAGALVIARLVPEATGDDRSYLAIESRGEISVSSLLRDLAMSDLEVRHIAQVASASSAGSAWHLVEAPGLVLVGDPRLAALLARQSSSINRILCLGGYARPIDPADLDVLP
ncbi:MAG: chorismate mutase [Alphaproteobacteria bacterium]|nr:chorismate mutase [Alphaproteobacteria bacterium]